MKKKEKVNSLENRFDSYTNRKGPLIPENKHIVS